jgi:cytochrome c peroxidase
MTLQTDTIAPAAIAARSSSMERWRWALAAAGAILLVFCAVCAFLFAYPAKAPAFLVRTVENWTGANPRPVTLLRAPTVPLSALAQLGEKIFHDPAMSASGRQSCASCHDPARSYGPPNARDVQLGGLDMKTPAFRPPPSLAYLYTQDPFGIGPAVAEQDDAIPLDQLAQQARADPRASKTAGVSTVAAMVPMMNPAEMANTDVYSVGAKLARAPYRDMFKPLFGADILNNPALLFIEAMSALSRFQVESASFHRFDSKYDHWLEGKARLTHTEMRGLRLFNDPAKGNCAACHLSQPSKDGLPPLFTDTEYEALGVPRNTRLAANRDPRFFDMGLCGPLRKDLAKQTQYCGMFLTPTLRNSARRGTYFHNGVYHDLKQVLDFYNLRDVRPERIYPRDGSGRVVKYDDLPARLHANIDTADAPFDRKPGDQPALTDGEIGDIIAFLHTLDDGDAASGSVY